MWNRISWEASHPSTPHKTSQDFSPSPASATHPLLFPSSVRLTPPPTFPTSRSGWHQRRWSPMFGNQDAPFVLSLSSLHVALPAKPSIGWVSPRSPQSPSCIPKGPALWVQYPCKHGSLQRFVVVRDGSGIWMKEMTEEPLIKSYWKRLEAQNLVFVQ